MDYLNGNNENLISQEPDKLKELQEDGELTKVKPQMSSFKLYSKETGKKESKKDQPVEAGKLKTKAEEEDVIKLAHKSRFSFGSVNLTDRMMFMDNMSTMLKAGLSLAPALKTLKQEVKNKYFRNIITYLYRHVENGQPLSKGMKNYPKVFQEMVVATVEVGEATGMLADSFGHLASVMKKQKELRSKVISAVMYPSIVILALIAVSLFLALVIFPQLVGLFESAGVQLPFVLRAVNAINFILRNYWYYIIAGLLAIFILLRIFFNLPKPKLWLHKFMLKWPFIGKLLSEMALTTLTGNLRALLAAGLPIVKSMEIAAKTLGNMKYRKEVLAMSQELEKGMSLEKTMSKRSDIFPSLTIQLCQVGETTGELEEILGKISQYYEDRVSNILTNLSAILEPFLLVVVGIAVGFIAVSVIAPMYELTLSFAD